MRNGGAGRGAGGKAAPRTGRRLVHRQRPKPPDRRRRNVLIAAVAASLAAALGFLGWTRIDAADKKIAELQRESAALDKTVEDAKKTVASAIELDKFADTDVTWLNEMRELAAELPPADDAILTKVTLTERAPRGGSPREVATGTRAGPIRPATTRSALNALTWGTFPTCPTTQKARWKRAPQDARTPHKCCRVRV